MSAIDLDKLLARESEQVEWKANVADWQDVIKTIVAFANDFGNLGGGYVVCGAHEGKDPHGFPRVEIVGLTASRLRELENKVLAVCRENVTPPLAPLTEELPGAGPDTRVLIFTVPATAYAHSYTPPKDTPAQYWVRIGRETVRAQNGLLRELLVRKGPLDPFDHRLHPQATVDDLDLLALRDTLVRMDLWDERAGVEPFLQPDRSMSAFMPSLCVREPLTGVVRPRNLALLLFGREPQRRFPGTYTQYEVYPGTDRGTDAAESHWIEGTAIRQAERLLDLLNLAAHEILDKTDLTEPNIERFPRRALKEAVVNAIVHRDYEQGQPTRVTVFSDRVEILSPGALPRAVDRDAFLRGAAPPWWRNQGIAWVFRSLQLAQSSGQGIRTIFRTLQERGFAPPTFVFGSDSVLCVIPAHPRHGRMRETRDAATRAGATLHASRAELLSALMAFEASLRGLKLEVEGSVTLRQDAELRTFEELAWRRGDGIWALQLGEGALDQPGVEYTELRHAPLGTLRLAIARLPDLTARLVQLADPTGREA